MRVMTNNKIKSTIKSMLRRMKAPNVTIHSVRGVTEAEDNGAMTVDRLHVSMGDCTGDEFEAIRKMRQDIETLYGIIIINVTIEL